jgi:hypothetical protein
VPDVFDVAERLDLGWPIVAMRISEVRITSAAKLADRKVEFC